MSSSTSASPLRGEGDGAHRPDLVAAHGHAVAAHELAGIGKLGMQDVARPGARQDDRERDERQGERCDGKDLEPAAGAPSPLGS